MSKQRKLQLEVESTMKKIAEGVDDWADLWATLDDTPEQSKERDKLAEVLKRDLKKLQRLRDQVRGWLASGEIKDEAPLIAGKRAIEKHMERYKQLERDQKVKAYSALGLARDSADPATMAKIRCADWLNDAASRLEAQTELLEADLEALGGTVGRGKAAKASKATASKAATLSARIERHREYQARIERVLRMLENDQVSAEEVEESLKESLDYFIEAHAEEDYVHDEYMWDALPLSVAVDEGVGKISDHRGGSGGGGGSGSGLGGGARKEEQKRGVEARPHVEVPPTPQVHGGTALDTDKAVGAAPSKGSVDTGKPVQTLDTNGTHHQQKHQVVEETEQTSKVGSHFAQAPITSYKMLLQDRQRPEQQHSVQEKLPLTPELLSESPRTPSGHVAPSPDDEQGYPSSAHSPFATPGLEIPYSRPETPASSAGAAVYEPIVGHATSHDVLSPGSHPATARSQTSIEIMNGSSPFAAKAHRAFTPQPSLEEQQAHHLIPSFLLESRVPDAEAESRASMGCRVASPKEHILLESSTQYMPIAGDGEWRRTDGSLAGYESSWKPPHPAISASSSLPRSIPSSLERDGMFNKMTLETAFVAFFCQQGSAQQRLAASALEAQGWRYHTELRTWFARRGTPMEQKETYERGKMAYWDSRLGQVMPGVYGGWCLRETPPDFCVEYSKLTALS